MSNRIPQDARSRLLILALAGLSLAPCTALARQDPTPPPSGVVVHLFGPDSLSNVILPGTPAQRAPGGQVSAAPGAGANGSAATAAPQSNVTWGSVAHQLFVTGDPATENAAALPKGRAGSKF